MKSTLFITNDLDVYLPDKLTRKDIFAQGMISTSCKIFDEAKRKEFLKKN